MWGGRSGIYELLENEIVPAFYNRDERGIPPEWISRMRSSLSGLALNFSANRMVREYVEKAYIPATGFFLKRKSGDMAKAIVSWQDHLTEGWTDLKIENVSITENDDKRTFEAKISLGRIDPGSIKVELYADALEGKDPVRIRMDPDGKEEGSMRFKCVCPSTRPADDFTVRIIPDHDDARIPLEDKHILWAR
jgi:starch phosphorylase